MDLHRKRSALLLLFCLLTGGVAAPFVHSFQHGHHQVHSHAEAHDATAYEGEGNLVAEAFKVVFCSLYAVPLCALDQAPDETPRLLAERELLQAPAALLATQPITFRHIRGPPHLS